MSRLADVRVAESENLSDAVRRIVDRELPDLLDVLNTAGFDGDFEVIGVGMTAIVLLDHTNATVLKVARSRDARDTIRTEFEFLVSLQGTDAAALVPRPIDYNEDAGVLVREGIEGRPGGWGTRGLREVYDAICAVAKTREWGCPEFKEDSFVVRDDGSIVMVDVGFTARFGQRLVAYVRERLAGPLDAIDAQQFAFELRLDVTDGRVLADDANALIRALAEKANRDFDLAGFGAAPVDEAARDYAMRFLAGGIPNMGWVLDSMRGASGKGLEHLEYVYISGFRPVPIGWAERFPEGTVVQVGAGGTRGVIRSPAPVDLQVIRALDLTPVRPKSIGALLWSALSDGRTLELSQFGGERAALIFLNPRRIWQASWFEYGVGPTGHIEAADPETLAWEAFAGGYRAVTPGAVDDIMASVPTGA